MGCQFSAGAVTSLIDSMHDLSGVRVANSEHLDNNTTTMVVPCPNLNLGMGLVTFASSSISAEPVDLICRARSHSSSAQLHNYWACAGYEVCSYQMLIQHSQKAAADLHRPWQIPCSQAPPQILVTYCTVCDRTASSKKLGRGLGVKLATNHTDWKITQVISPVSMVT